MVFSSLLFLFRFLPIMLVVYYCTPRRFRNAVLFGGSLVFYAWGEPVYIVLILFSTLVAYEYKYVPKGIFLFLASAAVLNDSHF